MAASPIRLAMISSGYHPRRPEERATFRGRLLLWGGGLLLAALIYLGANAFWDWKHVISSRGGRYFVHRIVLHVPAFAQGDPRWSMQLLGPTIDTMGQAGCAVTSAAMVMSFYGVDTDPQRLNAYLDTNGGYTANGWLYWEKAADLAPSRVQKAYEDLPSYALIDANLLAGNPVIVRLTLRRGETHFVVVVGKDGWSYLIRDPARAPEWGVYALSELTPRIEALRFYRVVEQGPMKLAVNPPAPSS